MGKQLGGRRLSGRRRHWLMKGRPNEFFSQFTAFNCYFNSVFSRAFIFIFRYVLANSTSSGANGLDRISGHESGVMTSTHIER